jgi:hypothetical protein
MTSPTNAIPISIVAAQLGTITYEIGVPDRVARSSRAMTRERKLPLGRPYPYAHADEPGHDVETVVRQSMRLFLRVA